MKLGLLAGLAFSLLVAAPVVAGDILPHPDQAVVDVRGAGDTRLAIYLDAGTYTVEFGFHNQKDICHVRHASIAGYSWPFGRVVKTYAFDGSQITVASGYVMLRIRTGCQWQVTVS